MSAECILESYETYKLLERSSKQGMSLFMLVVDRTPDFEVRPDPGPDLKIAGPSGRTPDLSYNYRIQLICKNYYNFNSHTTAV